MSDGLRNGQPLSAAQAGMWFAQQMDTSNPIFSGGQYVDIAGPVDEAVFVAAIRQTAHEAETLHVRFEPAEDGPRQMPHDHELPVPVLDMSAAADPVAAARDWMWSDMRKPVDLAKDTFYSTALIKVAADRYLWYQRAHHIVCDGYASSLVAGRLAEIYTAMMAGEPHEAGAFGRLSSLLQDDLGYRGSAQFADDRAYWTQRMARHQEVVGLAETTALPAHSFHRETVELSADTRDRIAALARTARTSWSVVICAAMALYVSRMRGVDEPVVGLPVAARFGPEMRRTPGMVANILPLPVVVRPAMSCAEFVRLVATEIKSALRHQRYRFEDLRRDLRLNSGQRLFGPTVDVLRFQGDLSFAGHLGTVDILSNGPVDDFNFVVYSGASIPGLRVCLDANPELYSADEMRRHRDRLALLLESLGAADPEQPIGAVPILHDDELERLLTGWQGGTRDIPTDTVAAQFEAQAARTPDSVAVTGEGPPLTYAELDTRSNQLARELLAAGAGPERFVAIAMPRTTELAVALLATLKTGAAYVPVDVSYPADRIGFMIGETDPVAVLTTTATAGVVPADADTPVIRLDSPLTRAQVDARSTDPVTPAERGRPVDPRQPAYVVYTSGSTGRPKGVVVSHLAMVDLLAWALDGIGRDDLAHVLASISLSFDPSVVELFAPLLIGGRVQILAGPLDLGGRPHKGGYAGSVPSVAAVLADGPGLDLEVGTLGFTGEALTEDVIAQVRKTAPNCRIANLYGPTEVGVYGTAWFSDDGEGTPAIGRPLPNTRVHILDHHLRLVPVGVVGEIYIAAQGLALGYLHQPALTAERFVADPFGAGGRMYRTGDLGRRRPDGVLEYLGRVDHQVKIRGFRVEPAEVEAVLHADPEVARAAVVVRRDSAHNPMLVGYVVPAPGTTPEAPAVLARLQQVLPDYLVPAALILLDEMPRTPSGKLDRNALPEPDRSAVNGSRPPRDDRERVLCQIVGELLDRSAVSIDDNFFDMGGNSLLVTKFISRVRTALGVELEVRSIFDAPTVALLAQQHLGTAQPARPRLVPRRRPAAGQEANR